MAQHASVDAWLRAGLDVVADEHCQSQDTMDAWRDLAQGTGARLAVWDYRWVPIEVCVDWDAQRGKAGGRLVGEDAIRRVAHRCAAVELPLRADVLRPTAIDRMR